LENSLKLRNAVEPLSITFVKPPYQKCWGKNIKALESNLTTPDKNVTDKRGIKLFQMILRRFDYNLSMPTASLFCEVLMPFR
jgi:hypothetical protein